MIIPSLKVVLGSSSSKVSTWEGAKHTDILSSQSVHPTLLEIVNKQLQNKAQSRILDIGCGTGTKTTELCESIDPQKLSSAHILGVDIANDAIEKARQQYSSQGRNFEVVDVTQENKTLLPDNSIDLAFAIGAISAIHDPEKMKDAFQNIFAAIKPEGTLYIQDFRRRATQLHKYILNSSIYHLPFGTTRVLKEDKSLKFLGYNFRRWQLNKWLREAGFQNIQIKAVDLPNQTSAQPSAKKITRKIWVVSATKPLDKVSSPNPLKAVVSDIINFFHVELGSIAGWKNKSKL